MIRSSSASKALVKDDRYESHEENGVLFWVNKSGFPIDNFTWERMWDHVAKAHPEGSSIVRQIRNNHKLPQVPFPQAPLTFSPSVSIQERLQKIQDYMIELQYNHTGTQFFEIRKSRPMTGLMECAKEMIREALPIKCLEAVILGIFLTNCMVGLERFPISFKTTFKGHSHRHIVLGLCHAGSYGAIGMSRREDLMYKPLQFKSLSDLVLDFEKCYKQYYHTVKKVKVGMPINHDQHSYEIISWKALVVTFGRNPQKDCVRELENHSRKMKSLYKSWSSSPYTSIKLLPTSDPMKEATCAESSSFGLSRRHTVVDSGLLGMKKKSRSTGALQVNNDYQIRI
ncbi:tubulinyl-Tyr carboxypeptidase 1-like [Physella acuta]|uniref:tubulinyl-Tyr carboxypeptidase 1-like n=1 Tax=Physella acuta TaxID=109671 RepID=UPI0027DB6EFA|nr:tubulinyl-Tyr carboxypeptidase 1-like [Physella acuta]XP_059161766.1 tubulinyl-Tyr carboxypeptidase 1-like [Physella acuta]XP_059161767.1 tubulinyl-Tyr carboxypeptidase 1-like [Physella acuta]